MSSSDSDSFESSGKSADREADADREMGTGEEAGAGAETGRTDQDEGSDGPAHVQPAHTQRDWDAFAFQHEKLKHLTTVGLVLSGGIITLFQSELMDPSPLALFALILPVASSMLTLAAQVSLGNEASTVTERARDAFGVPVTVHWVQLVAMILLASSLGWLASFFFRDVGLLP
jgi:hypothetical protein